MHIVKLTEQGTRRVLDGRAGMLFAVDSIGGVGNLCRHVRDYSRPSPGRDFQIWTLGAGDWEEYGPGAALTSVDLATAAMFCEGYTGHDGVRDSLQRVAAYLRKMQTQVLTVTGVKS